MNAGSPIGRLLALLAFASAPAAFAAGFAPTAQDRRVDVAITVTVYDCFPQPAGCSVVGTPVNHADAESAPGFSPFTATASVPGFDGYSATQSSSLTEASISSQGSGAHAGTGGYTPPPVNRATLETGSSDSHFEVSFDVDAPTPIHLTGSVVATGGLSANSTARIRLRSAGGATLAEVVAASDPDCQDASCETVGPFPIDHTSVLAPGSYVLEASTAGDAAPFFFAQNFFPVASTGQYQVELAILEVPALGRAGLALLALGLGVIAAARRRGGSSN